MKNAIVILAMMFSAQAFAAAATHECGALDSIGNLIGNTEHLGTAIKVAYVSTEEPAVAPDHLLVFVYDNEMSSTCTAISREADGGGFGYVDMKTLKTVSYDAKKGVLFSVVVSLPNFEDASKPELKTLLIRANQASGKVTLEN